MAEDCIFCRIVAGEIPAQVVGEDDLTLSFMDIAPSTPGHALVIPKRHSADIWEVSEEDFAAVALASQRLALRMRERLEPDGLNLINSCRPEAWQTVFHLHVHVIPRYRGDAVRPPWSPTETDPAEIARIAELLR